MKIPKDIEPYLRGEVFANAIEVPCPYYQVIPKRTDLLSQMAKGKNVLHLGCLDHLPLIDDKVNNGTWLHKLLTESASHCLGIDINQEAYEHVTVKYGMKNILMADITAGSIPQISNNHWDYAILGELLEHIDNPVHFLSEIRNKYKDHINEIVITVPNGFTIRNFRKAKQSVELINSDHRFWFTPYTIAKVVSCAGFEVSEILFANRIPLTTSGLIKQKLMKMIGKQPKYNFMYANSIVCIARFK